MVRDSVTGMNRNQVLSLLARHAARTLDANEAAMTAETIRFVELYRDCFLRSQLRGHLTGSAWILDPKRTKALLTHHKKLDKWVQLGGHADGNPDLWDVAQREASEESGLTRWDNTSTEIFDLDRHLIPARRDVPEHYHYDLRFLFEADPTEKLIVSSESVDLAWVPLAEMTDFNPEESIARMVRKSQHAGDSLI
jgi:8-oxo-dGTP pyrophosphatase MutT (NUDIX family)